MRKKTRDTIMYVIAIIMVFIFVVGLLPAIF